MKLVHDNSEEAVTKNDCQNVVNIFQSNINEWDVEGAVPYNGLLSREYNPPPLAVKVKGGGFFFSQAHRIWWTSLAGDRLDAVTSLP